MKRAQLKGDLWKSWNDFAMAIVNLKKAFDKHSEMWLKEKSTIKTLPPPIQKYLSRPEFNRGRFQDVMIDILEWTRTGNEVESLLVVGRAEHAMNQFEEKEKENA